MIYAHEFTDELHYNEYFSTEEYAAQITPDGATVHINSPPASEVVVNAESLNYRTDERNQQNIVRSADSGLPQQALQNP